MMNGFDSVPLTNAGRPIFISEEEVEIKSFENVEVYEMRDDSKSSEKMSKTIFESSSLLLTNARIIFILSTSSHSRISWGLNLKSVTSFEEVNKGLFRRSKRVRIFIKGDNNSSTRKEYECKFLEGDKEDFMEVFQRTLDRKSWEYILPKAVAVTAQTESKKVEEKKEETFSVKNAGIGGIIRRQEQNMQNMDQLTKTALMDLNHLIEKAREVVTTVQRYAQVIQEKKASSESSSVQDDTLSETTTQINERNEMETIMQEIGIISPVTRLSSGRSYHQQLAREICDILLSKQRLLRLGGMITLTDLYCLINKLHGTELVSPSDLLQASEYVEQLHLGIKLRIFPETQVKVLQLTSTNNGDDDNQFISRIVQLLHDNEDYQRNGITINDLMRSMNLSFLIVKELLLIAEKEQFICRDESVEGISFFLNQFDSFLQRLPPNPNRK
jgi:ESCRT-II complex subunit VPS36